ncbi:MAG: hemolysin III family protein [Gemmatimonadota bacterium]
MSGFYTLNEERFHAVTHGLGALLAVIGATYLMVQAVAGGDTWRIVSFAIYGTTLVLLYTASALYHAATRQSLKARLRVLDHASIYMLIAGSYTPFLLLRLWGPWGWILFGVVWALALGGVIYKLTLLDRYPRLSTALYLGMGWLALLAAPPLFQRLPTGTLLWLVAGGLVYSSGTLIYHLERVRYAHVIWHMFVLVGSACHYVAIARL